MRRRTHDDMMRMAQQIIGSHAQELIACHDEVERLQEQLAEKDRFWLDRVREVEDWGRAHSLEQLRGMHPTAAMELHPPAPERKLYHSDPTGMIVDEVDPRDYMQPEVG